jgi:hypothetical protein
MTRHHHHHHHSSSGGHHHHHSSSGGHHHHHHHGGGGCIEQCIAQICAALCRAICEAICLSMFSPREETSSSRAVGQSSSYQPLPNTYTSGAPKQTFDPLLLMGDWRRLDAINTHTMELLANAPESESARRRLQDCLKFSRRFLSELGEYGVKNQVVLEISTKVAERISEMSRLQISLDPPEDPTV